MKEKKVVAKKYKTKHVIARGKGRKRNDSMPKNVGDTYITNEEESLNSMSELSGESLRELELIK